MTQEPTHYLQAARETADAEAQIEADRNEYAEATCEGLEEGLVQTLEMVQYGDLPDAPAELEAMEVTGVTTFVEAGVMTYNRGLVVRTADGSEFQLTIVQSR